MSKLLAPLYVSLPRARKRVRTLPIIDTGSDFTLFPRLVADVLGVRRGRRETETISMMGTTIEFMFAEVDLFIPDTNCLLESFRVGFALGGDLGDIPYALVGVDFLQATGGQLDFGEGRHSVACDATARGPHFDQPVLAQRKRNPPIRRRR